MSGRSGCPARVCGRLGAAAAQPEQPPRAAGAVRSRQLGEQRRERLRRRPRSAPRASRCRAAPAPRARPPRGCACRPRPAAGSRAAPPPRTSRRDACRGRRRARRCPPPSSSPYSRSASSCSSVPGLPSADQVDVERRDRARPRDPVLVGVLLDRRRHDAGRADPVAAHHDRALLPVLVQVRRAQRLGVARAELEDVRRPRSRARCGSCRPAGSVSPASTVRDVGERAPRSRGRGSTPRRWKPVSLAPATYVPARRGASAITSTPTPTGPMKPGSAPNAVQDLRPRSPAGTARRARSGA